MERFGEDPSGNVGDISGVSKRKSEVSLVSDESDKTVDDLTASTRKKRVLFSTTLEENALENVMEHESLDDEEGKGDKNVIPSPVVLDVSKKSPELSSSVDISGSFGKNVTASSTRVEAGDDTERDITTRVEETDEEDNLTSALPDEVEYNILEPKKKIKSKAGAWKKGDKKPVPQIEVLPVTDSEDEEDIFSDASSVASVQLSKVKAPKGAIDDTSSEESDEEVISSAPTPPKKAKSKANRKEELKPTQTRSSRSSRTSNSSVASSSQESPKVIGMSSRSSQESPKVTGRSSRSSQESPQVTGRSSR